MSDLKAENATLRLLVAGLTIAVDMEPSDDPLEEPWVRLVEAAHKHGRRLERAAIVADLHDALHEAQGLTGCECDDDMTASGHGKGCRFFEPMEFLYTKLGEHEEAT